MKTTVKAIILATAILSFSVHADARSRGEGHRERGEMMKKMMQELDLSDEQKSKLKDIRKEIRPKMKELRSQVREARTKLNEAFETDAPESQIRLARNEMKSARSQMGDIRFEKMLSIRKILTPEQRKKFHELKGNRKRNRDF